MFTFNKKYVCVQPTNDYKAELSVKTGSAIFSLNIKTFIINTFFLLFPENNLTGFSNKINSAGVRYYRNLLRDLRANNIEPLVTLYHFDLPQGIQDAGGWPNKKIVKWFKDYARICFELFGDMVKYWITINEPLEQCYQGYGIAQVAPGLKSVEAEFLCAHHVILAHGEVYHLYNQKYRKTQKGLYLVHLEVLNTYNYL